VFLNAGGKFRIGKDCAGDTELKEAVWFILPPVQEYYYRKKNPFYKVLPPLMKGCYEESGLPVMAFIYPDRPCKLIPPRELDGSMGKIVFRLAHRDHKAIVFWHLDESFIGSTSGQHQSALSPAKGKHIITAIDTEGNKCSLQFEITSN
jgi:penicillin-binding protein 1C